MAATLGVSARPAVTAVAADDRSCQTGFHRHDSENDREYLAGAAVVEAGAEVDIYAKPGGDQLVMGVDIVGATHHHAINVLIGQAGVVERSLDGLFQERQRIQANLAEATLAGADDGILVAKRIHFRVSDLLWPARSCNRSRRGKTSSRKIGISCT